MRILRSLLQISLVMLLTIGCVKPPFVADRSLRDLVPAQGIVASAPPLEGKVEFPRYRTQSSSISDIAAGATVMLIDATSNRTISSTVTKSDGSAVLKSDVW